MNGEQKFLVAIGVVAMILSVVLTWNGDGKEEQLSTEQVMEEMILNLTDKKGKVYNESAMVWKACVGGKCEDGNSAFEATFNLLKEVEE